MQKGRSDKSVDPSSHTPVTQGNGTVSLPAVPVLQEKKAEDAPLAEYWQKGHSGTNPPPAQGKFATATNQTLPPQQPAIKPFKAPVQKRSNDTGLPDGLKNGIESLSGFSMDNVKVHYNSDKPAQLKAYAYAQGTDIHIAPGQEQHLAHEAWHVVQQAQGRVRPTMQMKQGISVNDDKGLEHEADVMGAKAMEAGVQLKAADSTQEVKLNNHSLETGITQLKLAEALVAGTIRVAIAGETHDEIKPEKEKEVWSAIDVTVYHENEDIPLDDEREVTPDPLVLRISFGYTSVEKHLGPFLTEISKAGKRGSKESAGFADWAFDYLTRVLRNNLDELPSTNLKKAQAETIIAQIERLKGPVKFTELITTDSSTRVDLAQQLRQDFGALGTIINAIHTEGGFGKVAFNADAIEFARSKAMLQHINKASGSLTETIYKVGNRHALDMQRKALATSEKDAGEWLQYPQVTVLNKDEYRTEYEQIKAEIATMSTPSGGSGARPVTATAPVGTASTPASGSSAPLIPSGGSGSGGVTRSATPMLSGKPPGSGGPVPPGPSATPKASPMVVPPGHPKPSTVTLSTPKGKVAGMASMFEKGVAPVNATPAKNV